MSSAYPIAYLRRLRPLHFALYSTTFLLNECAPSPTVCEQDGAVVASDICFARDAAGDSLDEADLDANAAEVSPVLADAPLDEGPTGPDAGADANADALADGAAPDAAFDPSPALGAALDAAPDARADGANDAEAAPRVRPNRGSEGRTLRGR